jgi:hypothetical protein
MSDGYDVVFQKGPREIIEAFLSYQKPLVISAERGEGYEGLSNTLLPETPNPLYRSLNSGLWMAYVGAARNVIDEMRECSPEEDQFNDQKMFYRWYARNQERATVDYENVLVTSTNYKCVDEDLDYRDGLVSNKHTGTVPCAVHLSAWTDMSKVYEVLRLSS